MRRRDARERILDREGLDALVEKVRKNLEQQGIRVPLFDLGPCPVPSCAAKARHGWLIRKDGGFVRENKVYVCEEHMRELGDDRLAVDGEAPDELVWISGEREVAAWRAAPGELH